ncbi:MAG: UDP-2,3-diacylglucosamine diphosphatase [Campylobacter sp.]|nr:UDP-2,3-diacylglucosamine diphosphatase [Campylobacter sp.]
MQILPGAIFISDAHENTNRADFLNFLKAVNSGLIQTPQLFLMGDMFDFLTGYGKYTSEFFAEHIELINQIANKTQVIYVEGNHDFRLKNLFTNVLVFEIQKQPALFQTINGESVSIAHGDIFLPFISKYALRFLRVKFFLKFMNFIDILLNFKISKGILSFLTRKKIDYKIPEFKDKISPKMRHYSTDIVIEGHYHQGVIFDIENRLYVNIPLFACDQSFFVVKYPNQKLQFEQIHMKGH